MFKATVVSYADLPDDVNRDSFEAYGVEKYCDDYLVVQVDGITTFCRPVPDLKLPDYGKMIEGLAEKAFYLGAMNGIKQEQGYMEGKTLKVLDAGKHKTRIRGG